MRSRDTLIRRHTADPCSPTPYEPGYCQVSLRDALWLTQSEAKRNM
jgi:hypothetical protein